MPKSNYIEPIVTVRYARRQHCLAILKRRARISALTAAVPVPGLDLATDTAMLIEVLGTISSKYGLDPKHLEDFELEKQALFMQTLKRAGPSLIGKVLTPSVIGSVCRALGVRVAARQCAKLVPIIGTATAAAIAYNLFMAIGKRHIDHCEIVHAAVYGPKFASQCS
jgi:hypothetical protein